MLVLASCLSHEFGGGIGIGLFPASFPWSGLGVEDNMHLGKNDILGIFFFKTKYNIFDLMTEIQAIPSLA